MTFDHAWALLLAVLPVAWAAWEWRWSARRPALILKAATLFCILLALSVPSMTVYQTKVAVAFLADTSASVTAQDLKFESAMADKIESGRGRHWTRVIPFARVTRPPSADEHSKDGWQVGHTGAGPGTGP